MFYIQMILHSRTNFDGVYLWCNFTAFMTIISASSSHKNVFKRINSKTFCGALVEYLCKGTNCGVVTAILLTTPQLKLCYRIFAKTPHYVVSLQRFLQGHHKMWCLCKDFYKDTIKCGVLVDFFENTPKLELFYPIFLQEHHKMWCPCKNYQQGHHKIWCPC